MPDRAAVTELLEANELLRSEVAGLARKTEQLAKSNDALAASDTRQRHGLIALAVGGGLLTLVLLIVVYALVQIDETNDRLDDQAQYDVASCERANTTRAGQRQQWTDVRGLLMGLGAGPETRKLADALVANANRNFPPLDCSALSRGEEPQPILPSPTPR